MGFVIVRERERECFNFVCLIVFFFPPKKGVLCCFIMLIWGGENDLRSLHASSPVLEGVKWAAVKWIREDYWGL